MSVRITITREDNKVTFSDPAPEQNDLVFWNNQDGEPHFPVPNCGGLLVAPGKTTPPRQPFPNPDSPIVYGCAIPGHENEKGRLSIRGVVRPDPASGTTKTIEITRSAGVVSFTEVDIHQADSVQWTNKDSQNHYPVPNCTGLRVDPGGVTNPLQPAAAVAGLPMPLLYGCAIPGHENESGTINIYDNFTVVPNSRQDPIIVPTVQPFQQAAVATGGKSPYKLTPDAVLNGVFFTLEETTPVGSSSGVSAVVKTLNRSGPRDYFLQVEDALGAVIQTVIWLSIGELG